MGRGPLGRRVHFNGRQALETSAVFCPQDSTIPSELLVVNDHGNHYNWEPNVDLTLTEFIALLGTTESAFHRISWLSETHNEPLTQSRALRH